MSTPAVLEDMSNLREWCRRLAKQSNLLLRGKTNNYGTVTLTANVAVTTVSESVGRLGSSTVIVLTPSTATAATEFGAGTLYVSSVDVINEKFIITHVNSAVTTRTFNYALIG